MLKKYVFLFYFTTYNYLSCDNFINLSIMIFVYKYLTSKIYYLDYNL